MTNPFLAALVAHHAFATGLDWQAAEDDVVEATDGDDSVAGQVLTVSLLASPVAPSAMMADEDGYVLAWPDVTNMSVWTIVPTLAYSHAHTSPPLPGDYL